MEKTLQWTTERILGEVRTLADAERLWAQHEPLQQEFYDGPATLYQFAKHTRAGTAKIWGVKVDR